VLGKKRGKKKEQRLGDLLHLDGKKKKKRRNAETLSTLGPSTTGELGPDHDRPKKKGEGELLGKRRKRGYAPRSEEKIPKFGPRTRRERGGGGKRTTCTPSLSEGKLRGREPAFRQQTRRKKPGVHKKKKKGGAIKIGGKREGKNLWTADKGKGFHTINEGGGGGESSLTKGQRGGEIYILLSVSRKRKKRLKAALDDRGRKKRKKEAIFLLLPKRGGEKRGRRRTLNCLERKGQGSLLRTRKGGGDFADVLVRTRGGREGRGRRARSS